MLFTAIDTGEPLPRRQPQRVYRKDVVRIPLGRVGCKLSLSERAGGILECDLFLG